jgi:hypothetical protein
VVLTVQVPGRPNLRGEARFYQDMLIHHQSYHGDYACFYGGVVVSDSDGMNSSTRVPAVRYAWATVATSCHTRH